MSGMHPHPEALYYHIAKDMLDLGRTEADEYKKKQFIASSLVFSALCLEVFINQEYAAHAETKKVMGDGDRIPLENKWLLLPLLLKSDKTFEPGCEPFQTFRDLVKTRNDRLVHFKPLQEGNLHGGKAKMSRRYFADLVSDVALADKYLECVRNMIEKLAELTGKKTSIPSFLTGNRYISTVWVDCEIPMSWGGE